MKKLSIIEYMINQLVSEWKDPVYYVHNTSYAILTFKGGVVQNNYQTPEKISNFLDIHYMLSLWELKI